MRPLLLDLFCGAGGAAVGYHRAGFDVVGVDINPQPNYPFPLVQADAMMFDLGGYKGYDVVHASPPCQAYSAGARMRNGRAKDHPRLIEPMRERLLDWHGIYVIENVPGAPLRSPLVLCGSSFGLDVRRHRGFESNVLLFGTPCAHRNQPLVVGVYGDHPENALIRKGHPAIRARTVAHAQEAMGMDWSDEWSEIKEAVPPAFTEYIGTQLMEAIMRTSSDVARQKGS